MRLANDETHTVDEIQKKKQAQISGPGAQISQGSEILGIFVKKKKNEERKKQKWTMKLRGQVGLTELRQAIQGYLNGQGNKFINASLL